MTNPKPELDFEPEALTYVRKNAGLTKRALANRAGISEQYMGDLEAGRRNARPGTINALAKALNCPRVLLEKKLESEPEPEPVAGL